MGERATDPTPVDAKPATTEASTASAPSAGDATDKGVSVPADPTDAPLTELQLQAVSSTHAGVQVSAPTPSDPAKPYLGKRYSQVPDWISLDDWEAGGGTLNDYYY